MFLFVCREDEHTPGLPVLWVLIMYLHVRGVSKVNLTNSDLFCLLVVKRQIALGFPKLGHLKDLRSNLPVSLCLAKNVVALGFPKLRHLWDLLSADTRDGLRVDWDFF